MTDIPAKENVAAEVVDVADDKMTPAERFAAARMFQGKDKTASYLAAFPETGLEGKSLYNAASNFSVQAEVVEAMKNAREFSRGRLDLVVGNFIDYTERFFLRPIMEAMEKDDAAIAEMGEEALRRALTTSMRQNAILTEELAGSGKKSPLTANLARWEKLAGIIRNIGDVLADKGNKTLIVNMPAMNDGEGDRRIWHSAALPTAKGDWRFDVVAQKPVHITSFQMGIAHATKKYGGGQLRCPGGLGIPGQDGSLCYADFSAGGDGNGNRRNEDG